jgi:hypothetical protein
MMAVIMRRYDVASLPGVSGFASHDLRVVESSRDGNAADRLLLLLQYLRASG